MQMRRLCFAPELALRARCWQAFTQTGGARLGWGNVSCPFAKLSATEESICLSVFGGRQIFPKSSIRGLSRHGGIFSTGLRIESEQMAHGKKVIFWTFDFQSLKNALEELGYKIHD
jgi:hypothetical protein